MSRTAFDALTGFARDEPDALALLSEQDGTRTFGELVERATTLGRALRERVGVGAGERMSLWLGNHPEWIETYLATQAAGVALVTLDPQWTDDEVIYALGHSESVAVVCDGTHAARLLALRTRLPTLRSVVALAVDGEAVPPGALDFDALMTGPAPDPVAARPLSEGSPATHIMYTSGTTAGRPKAARVRVGGAGATDYVDMFGLSARDRAVIVTPFFHANGIGGATVALSHGASVVFTRRFSARGFWPLVDRFRPTYLWTLSPIANILLSLPPDPRERRHGMRVGIVAGGGARNADIAEARFGFPVLDIYGMTEALGVGTYNRLHDPRRPGSAGRRAPGSPMVILRDDGTEAAPGEQGEVAFPIAAISFDGYIDDEAATAAAVDGTYFRTGDLGTFDEDGYFFFVERAKDIVRRGGENISSIEIEEVLRTFDGVAEAAVVAKPDAVLGERVVAFVVTIADATVDPEELRAHVGGTLAAFKVPDEIHFVGEFPRTAAGKIVKKRLRDRLEGR